MQIVHLLYVRGSRVKGAAYANHLQSQVKIITGLIAEPFPALWTTHEHGLKHSAREQRAHRRARLQDLRKLSLPAQHRAELQRAWKVYGIAADTSNDCEGSGGSQDEIDHPGSVTNAQPQQAPLDPSATQADDKNTAAHDREAGPKLLDDVLDLKKTIYTELAKPRMVSLAAVLLKAWRAHEHEKTKLRAVLLKDREFLKKFKKLKLDKDQQIHFYRHTLDCNSERQALDVAYEAYDSDAGKREVYATKMHAQLQHQYECAENMRQGPDVLMSSWFLRIMLVLHLRECVLSLKVLKKSNDEAAEIRSLWQIRMWTLSPFQPWQQHKSSASTVRLPSIHTKSGRRKR